MAKKIADTNPDKEKLIKDLLLKGKKKGSISDWPAARKLITILRHFLIRLFLNINYDASGAFRCINTKKIKIDDQKLIQYVKTHPEHFL